MTAPRRIAGLSEIADRYDVLLCDVWGVIHNGQASFPDACAALARYKAERGPVILISNAPRPASAVRPQLTQLAVPDAAWTDFVTSGDATRKLLALPDVHKELLGIGIVPGYANAEDTAKLFLSQRERIVTLARDLNLSLSTS